MCVEWSSLLRTVGAALDDPHRGPEVDALRGPVEPGRSDGPTLRGDRPSGQGRGTGGARIHGAGGCCGRGVAAFCGAAARGAAEPPPRMECQARSSLMSGRACSCACPRGGSAGCASAWAGSRPTLRQRPAGGRRPRSGGGGLPVVLAVGLAGVASGGGRGIQQPPRHRRPWPHRLPGLPRPGSAWKEVRRSRVVRRTCQDLLPLGDDHGHQRLAGDVQGGAAHVQDGGRPPPAAGRRPPGAGPGWTASA